MDYMGIFVERDAEPAIDSGAVVKCGACIYEDRVDRAECNACARAWQATGTVPGFESFPLPA